MERSETIGLGVAAAGHVLLLALLSLQLGKDVELPPPSPSITVQLSDEIGLESTAPDPSQEPAPLVTPDQGEIAPAQSRPEPLPSPFESPPENARPTPAPERPAPTRPTASPKPKPRPKPTPKASPAKTEAKSRPAPAAKPAGKPAETPRKRTSRLSGNFLDGTSDSKSDSTDTRPAAKAGAAEQAALEREIARKLKPHWTAPTGADAELLVTRVSWSMDTNGRVTGTPSCRQTGKVTASNRPQVELHCERAKAAILKAQPFNTLPDKFYDVWKNVVFSFDRKLG